MKHVVVKFQSKEMHLDILICSPGIKAVDARLTADRFKVQFGINHLGHGLLIQTLLPVLQSTATLSGNVHVILLAFLGFKMHPCHSSPSIPSAPCKRASSVPRYATGKASLLTCYTHASWPVNT
jgi:NAD(P)-dependent dehydrogenase (short-subunit alcohol dehydrogenase family)